MNVLFVASEVSPLAKSGGLADFAGSLPAALVATGGVNVDVLTPAYGPSSPPADAASHHVDLGAGGFDLKIETRVEEPGRRTLLVHCPALFGRASLYGESGTDYPDNPIRFAVLSRVAADLAPLHDLVHANDWHAALTLEYLRSATGRTRVASVFTVHNAAFQGVLHPAWMPLVDVADDRFAPDGVEYFGRLNLLKAALTTADSVTTVSSTHAAELTREPTGFGLDGVFRSLHRPIVGIPNGIPAAWDPSVDPLLPRRFDRSDLSGKRACREALCRRFGLGDVDATTPIVASVGRLTWQKGADLLLEAIRPLLAHDRVKLVWLGSGDVALEDQLRDVAATFAGRAGVVVGHDEALAHLVEAGADMFVMPSRYEPCGTNQMLSMRYGTVPIAHATGGLVDTITDADEVGGTGFLFSPCTAPALKAALDRAIVAFAAESPWQTLIANGMKRDFSWNVPAQRYLALYRRTLEERHDPFERR